MTTSRTIPETVSGFLSDGLLLISQEVKLAKAEAAEKIEQAQSGLISIFASMIVALAAVLILAQALVLWLEAFMPLAGAAALVGGVLAVVAIIMLLTGRNNLKPSNLTPERSMKSIRDDAETFKKGL